MNALPGALFAPEGFALIMRFVRILEDLLEQEKLRTAYRIYDNSRISIPIKSAGILEIIQSRPYLHVHYNSHVVSLKNHEDMWVITDLILNGKKIGFPVNHSFDIRRELAKISASLISDYLAINPDATHLRKYEVNLIK